MAEEAKGVTTESVETPGEAPTPTETPAEPAAPEKEAPAEAKKPEAEKAVEEEGKEPSKKPETRSEKRIRQLIEERKELRRQLGEKRKETTPPLAPRPTIPPAAGRTPEVQRAVDELRELGFVTQEDMRRDQDRMALETEYDRLEREYNGSDGRPKFDRKVVEDFSIYKGLYDPESAYKILFEDELKDFDRKQTLASKPEVPYTEKPAPAAGKEPPLTREDIAKMPREEYERRRPEILKAMTEGAL